MIELDDSMFEIFREDVRHHTDMLSQGLLDTEANPGNPAQVEPLMRAAHSIKGACRIIGIDLGVRLAHVMEDVLVAAQNQTIQLTPADVDLLLRGSDVLRGLTLQTPETIDTWEKANTETVTRIEPLLKQLAVGVHTETQQEPCSIAEAPSTDLSSLEHPQQVESLASSGNGFPPVPPFTEISIPTDPLVLPPNHSMLDLFREELRTQLLVIKSGLGSDYESVLESLKQIRGAARIVKSPSIERVAQALSLFISDVRDKKAELTKGGKDWLSFSVSTLAGVIGTDEESFQNWLARTNETLAEIATVFERVRTKPTQVPVKLSSAVQESINTRTDSLPPPIVPKPEATATAAPIEAVVRVTANSLNRLMGLAGESLVQARWLPSFSNSLLVLRKQHDLLASLLDRAYHAASEGASQDSLSVIIADARRQASFCRSELSEKGLTFDEHSARAEDLNTRLYREVIVSRMRPFGDGIHGLPRLVRDMARALEKEAKLTVEGEKTEVDRDILEKLESPLTHLVRNALDHGIELPEERIKAGKPRTGTIRIDARHRAGMLQVTISDDGGGVTLEKLRRKIIERGLNAPDMVRKMSEMELLEFLFLPGFSTATTVTEFSGRGVGLDVVHDTIRKVGGSVRISTSQGRGTTFHLQLPQTLSVIRAVVVDIAGEPYAFPHTRIDRLTRIHRNDIRSLEHRQFFNLDGHNIGLVFAAQLLELSSSPVVGDGLPVVLLSDSSGSYGLVVDSFRGEQDLVVRPLDTRLGKVPNLSAAAILDDGSPVLIIDVEDLIRSADQFIQTGALMRCETRSTTSVAKKRILVVDDSFTVREVERQLLVHRGYDVSIAVDGMEGWNKIRSEKFDLLISDIDMPRMNGLQLVSAIRSNEKLRDLPVVIVSYKEREEDRLRGLEVGANCYLTKSSFHDNRFIEAVEDLIGLA
jgi:two-component system sensor histidine kinase and response regulator WspE